MPLFIGTFSVHLDVVSLHSSVVQHLDMKVTWIDSKHTAVICKAIERTQFLQLSVEKAGLCISTSGPDFLRCHFDAIGSRGAVHNFGVFCFTSYWPVLNNNILSPGICID